jgi:hypothetical protein
MRRIAGIAAVLVALAAGGGTAAACDHGGGTRTLAETLAARHHGFFFGTAITSYLQLSPVALKAQLASGKTLAQIATAQGKSVSGLVDAIVAAKQARLNALVSAGVITAAQESTFLARLRARVTAFVNVSWTMRHAYTWH